MDTQTYTTYIEALDLAVGKLRCALEDRDEAIVEALLAGISPNEIAQTVGITPRRVQQIGRAAAPLRLG